jgi:hypothetical protein
MVPTAHEPSEKLIYAQPAPCSDSPRLLGVVDGECLAGRGVRSSQHTGDVPALLPASGLASTVLSAFARLFATRALCMFAQTRRQAKVDSGAAGQGCRSDKMRTDHRRCCA